MRIITLALIGLLTTASQAGAKIGTVTEINGFGEIVRESNVVGNSEGTPLESMDTARNSTLCKWSNC